MLAPDHGRPLYWFSAGDILCREPDVGVRTVDVDAAARLHRFHLAELALAARAGRCDVLDFHRARERELRTAMAARGAWRRAAQLA